MIPSAYTFHNRIFLINTCMPRINYELDDLRALCALDRLGSFNKAADALCITASALSRRIAKLEQALGGRLVERTTRRMTFTALGAMVLERAQPLMESLDGCISDAVRVAQGKAGRIAVGCLASAAYVQYPIALRAFRSQFPDVQVSLRDDNGARVRAMILEREVDFGVTTLWETCADLVTEQIADKSYVVTMPPHHPFASRQRMRWSDLQDCRLLGFKPGSATRQQIDPELAAQGIELNWFDDVAQLSTMMALLATGEFVTVLPELLAPAFPAFVSIPLVEPRITFRVFLARRHDMSLSFPASVLWNELAAAVRLAGQAGVARGNHQS